MSFVAAATIGSAVIGGYSANKAADKQSDAAKKGIASTERLANQARMDAVNLFNQGKQSRLLGQSSALNFIKQNAQKINRPLIQGNMMAQQAIGQGGIQANNAILGLPVDMSFANNPQQVEADYSSINTAQLPILGGTYNVQGMTQPQSPQTLTEHLGNREVIFGGRQNVVR